MKKTLLTAIAVGALAMSALAQGEFTFSASSGNVKFSTDSGNTKANVPPVNGQATIAGFGNLNIQVWSAPTGTTLSVDPQLGPLFSGAWALDTFGGSTTQIKVFPQAGAISPATILTPSSAASVVVEVVAWTGTQTTWANAQANTGGELIGWSGSALSGGSVMWTQLIAAPPSPTPGTTTAGNGGFSGLTVSNVPEPTTMALGGLGAAALLLFRRRK